jgi:hypothetical protein
MNYPAFDRQDDGSGNLDPMDDETEAVLADPVAMEGIKEAKAEQDDNWADQSMWDRAQTSGPARPNPLFEPHTETISLSPEQAQRALAAQLATNMLKGEGRPAPAAVADDVVALAEWIMGEEVAPLPRTISLLPGHLSTGDRIDGGTVIDLPIMAENGKGVLLKIQRSDAEALTFVQPVDVPIPIFSI